MKFYHVKDTYIQFLKTYDNKVAENKNELRPYVGIVLEESDIKYYAPFTSPKQKHQKMHNEKDFRKIGGGRYGAINFNNMIPVPDDVLLYIDIEKEPDIQYRRLLQNQYNAVLHDMSGIEKTAKGLRELLLKDDHELSIHDKKIKDRCCNLPLLESVYMQYTGKIKS